MNTVVRHKEFIFEESPTFMCHASSILPLDDGRVLAVWFGGSREGESDVGIWFSSREKTGWTMPLLLAQSEEPHWNPVLFEMLNGCIALFFKVGKRISKWRTMVCFSYDRGRTWTVPSELVQGDFGGRGPVRNKIIRLQSGRVLAPASTESGIWTAFCDISDDECKTWVRSSDIRVEGLEYQRSEKNAVNSGIEVSSQSFEGRGVIQPTLWESEAQKIHMFLRSSEGRIYRSDSPDNGTTWCSAYPIDLPNNNSGIDLDRTLDGSLFLVYNPVSENWGARTPITLALSVDNGNKWRKIFDLDMGEGEFSYPCIVIKDASLYISYTWKRKKIRYFVIDYT